jgi:branched-chain amino acid transport system permease protein
MDNLATTVAIQFFNGLVIGMIYALIGIGLTLILGLLDIPNFAHGALYALGAYLLLQLVGVTGSFWLGMLVAPVIVFTVSVILERFMIRPLYPAGSNYVLLFTFAVSVIVQELIIILWGPVGFSILPPQALAGSVDLGPFSYPRYHLFVMIASLAVILGLWLMLERTRYGAIMRAGIENKTMVSALGIDIYRLFTVGFGLGASLAALAGVLIAPIRGLMPYMGVDILPFAFVVVAVGGLGNVIGAIAAGLIIGVTQSLTTQFWPQGSTITIFGVMAIILLTRPQGLFGAR